MLEKNTFDWMRQQLNGYMRTQIIAAAATLSLADHLQNGPRTVEEIASLTGLERDHLQVLACARGDRFGRQCGRTDILCASSSRDPSFHSSRLSTRLGYGLCHAGAVCAVGLFPSRNQNGSTT